MSSILKIMTASHKKLNDEFLDLLEAKDLDYLIIKKAYENFLKNIKNHFATEEQSIFSFFYPKDKEKFKIIPMIVNQHSEILKLLEDLGENLFELEKYDFSDLKELLNEHIILENTALYNEMDKSLTETEKDFIVKKISNSL